MEVFVNRSPNRFSFVIFLFMFTLSNQKPVDDMLRLIKCYKKYNVAENDVIYLEKGLPMYQKDYCKIGCTMIYSKIIDEFSTLDEQVMYRELKKQLVDEGLEDHEIIEMSDKCSRRYDRDDICKTAEYVMQCIASAGEEKRQQNASPGTPRI